MSIEEESGTFRKAGDRIKDFVGDIDYDRIKDKAQTMKGKVATAKAEGTLFDGELMKDFASNIDYDGIKDRVQNMRTKYENKRSEGGLFSFDRGKVKSQPVGSREPYKPETNSNQPAASSKSDNSTNRMAGYVAPKPEKWAAQNSNDYKGFTGGEAGVDSPDLSYGQVITSPSGTKTQYGADGSMRTYGTDEALESAYQNKQDQRFSVTNRKVDYDTHLPDDFDPSGKDAYGHNMWLYELTGSEHFLNKAQGMKSL